MDLKKEIHTVWTRLSTNLEKSNAQDSSAVVVGVGGEGGATWQEHAQLTTNNAAQVLED